MLADMHAHYPMHFLADLTPRTTATQMGRVSGRSGLGRKARALVLKLATHLFSDRDPFSGYRVTTELLVKGKVKIVFSVLYCPFEELDLTKVYTDPPEASYFPRLMQDLTDVEVAIVGEGPATVRVVRTAKELDACIKADVIAVVHCVEGAFTLGPANIARNVATLKRHGVAYVTVAHLFFRQVAANAPCLPFLSDRCYQRLFPKPKTGVITPLGYAALDALVDNRIAIDISHMRDDAIRATFAFLATKDPRHDTPVISSHAGCRFKRGHLYMHDDWTIKKIADTDGVIGLILGKHLLNDGVKGRGKTEFDRSCDVLRQHIERISKVTGGLRHIGIGSDFDGFVKPTMPGLQNMADMPRLEDWLHKTYPADADAIIFGNAKRVLDRVLA